MHVRTVSDDGAFILHEIADFFQNGESTKTLFAARGYTYIHIYHTMYNIIHALCIPVHAVPHIQYEHHVLFLNSMTKNGTTLLNSLIGMSYTTSGSVCQILTTLLFR